MSVRSEKSSLKPRFSISRKKKHEDQKGGGGSNEDLEPEYEKSLLTDPKKGLSEADVMDRTERFGPNDLKKTKHYLEKIKIQRYEVEVARKEREQKRKKNAIARKKAEEEIENRVADHILLNKLLHQSKEERKITEQLLKIRKEKENIIKNRIEKEAQYLIIRQKEYEDALEREHRLYLSNSGPYRNQVGMDVEKHLEIMEAKTKMDHDKNMEWIHESITLQVVDLAFKSIRYKTQHDKKAVPSKMFREWKLAIFRDLVNRETQDLSFANRLVSKPIVFNNDQQESDIEVSPESKLLDADELIDYINYSGSWDNGGGSSGLIKNHDALANLIDKLIVATTKVEEVTPVIPLPLVPIRMALIGKRYSGKRTMARFLASQYNLAIVDIDELIKDAVAQAVDLTQKKKEKVTPSDSKDVKKTVLTKQQIGAKIQMSMSEGQAPDDNYLVQLVADVLNHQDPECTGGWVIVDFPKTKQQVQLLERELSGYEDPKPLKKGDVKKVEKAKEKVHTPTSASLRSRAGILQANENLSDVPVGVPVSGLDAVILLDVTNDTVLKRAADLKSELPPDGMSQSNIVDDSEKLISGLQAFVEEEEGIKEWLSQFKTLQQIDANNKTEEQIELEVESFTNELVNYINKTQLEQRGSQGDYKTPSDDDINKPRPSSSLQSWLSVSPENGNKREDTTKSERRMSTLPSDKQDIEGSDNLSSEMGVILIKRWAQLENRYTEAMKTNFRALRKRLYDCAFAFYNTKLRFQNLLKTPDREQKLIETFQKEFNVVDAEWRSNAAVKRLLCERVDELRDRLWEIVDGRRDQAEAERLQIVENMWIDKFNRDVAKIIMHMMQAECDRYVATCKFIIDYHKEVADIPSSAASATEDEKIVVLALFDACDGDVDTNVVRIPVDFNDDIEATLTRVFLALQSSFLSQDNESTHPFLTTQSHLLNQRFTRLATRISWIRTNAMAKRTTMMEQLDAWISARYKIESDAVSALVVMVRECVGAAQQVPRDTMMPHFGALVLPREKEWRGGSPVEERKGGGGGWWSVTQLRILTTNLKQIAPTGVIGCKLLMDYFLKASLFAGSSDGLPPSFIGTDAGNIERAVKALDPFKSGMISWRKFWMIQSHLLPISMEDLAGLKKDLGNGNGIGMISKREFFQKTLWFERVEKPTPGQFNRPAKIKQALFEVFSSSGENDEFDSRDFLMTCCCSSQPLEALEKAFLVASSTNDGRVQRSQVLGIFNHFMYRQPPPPQRRTKSGKRPTSSARENARLAAEEAKKMTYQDNQLARIFEFAAALAGDGGQDNCGDDLNASVDEQRVTFAQFVEGCRQVEGGEVWLECPLFPIEDFATLSRPSSGI